MLRLTGTLAVFGSGSALPTQDERSSSKLELSFNPPAAVLHPPTHITHLDARSEAVIAQARLETNPAAEVLERLGARPACALPSPPVKLTRAAFMAIHAHQHETWPTDHQVADLISSAATLRKGLLLGGAKQPLVLALTYPLADDANWILSKAGVIYRRIQLVSGLNTKFSCFRATIAKLAAWTLSDDYDRIVLLDFDVVVMCNLDRLFDTYLNGGIAARNQKNRIWMKGHLLTQLNSGVMVMQPNANRWTAINRTLYSILPTDLNITCEEENAALRGDQRFLSYHFGVVEQQPFRALPDCFNNLDTKSCFGPWCSQDPPTIHVSDGTCVFHSDYVGPDMRHDYRMDSVPSFARQVTCEWRRQWLAVENELHGELARVPRLNLARPKETPAELARTHVAGCSRLWARSAETLCQMPKCGPPSSSVGLPEDVPIA